MICLLLVLLLGGCGQRRSAQPTRTPVPTYTPTPVGWAGENVVVVAENSGAAAPQQVATPTQVQATEPTATPLPPTVTPIPTATPIPTDTPIPTETPTPLPTATPTETPTPSPTPTPEYAFALVEQVRFPAVEGQTGVRVFLYVFDDEQQSLADYGLRVLYNGQELSNQVQSAAGLPAVTRPGPGPYSRFTNLQLDFGVLSAGVWEVQLLDEDGRPAGPSTSFTVTVDDPLRQLYVRYRRK